MHWCHHHSRLWRQRRDLHLWKQRGSHRGYPCLSIDIVHIEHGEKALHLRYDVCIFGCKNNDGWPPHTHRFLVGHDLIVTHHISLIVTKSAHTVWRVVWGWYIITVISLILQNSRWTTQRLPCVWCQLTAPRLRTRLPADLAMLNILYSEICDCRLQSYWDWRAYQLTYSYNQNWAIFENASSYILSHRYCSYNKAVSAQAVGTRAVRWQHEHDRIFCCFSHRLVSIFNH